MAAHRITNEKMIITDLERESGYIINWNQQDMSKKIDSYLVSEGFEGKEKHQRSNNQMPATSNHKDTDARSNHDQLFNQMMKLQSPQPWHDPRRKYDPQYFLPNHVDYKKSVMRMLSYALSSSLNNYHSVLKNCGFFVLKTNVVQPNDSQELIDLSNIAKSTKAICAKQKNSRGRSAKQVKKINKKQISLAKRQSVEKQQLSSNHTSINSDSEQRKANLNIEHPLAILIGRTLQQDIKQKDGKTCLLSISPHRSDKPIECEVEENTPYLRQARLPKFGMSQQQSNSIRENLLMRQVAIWPVKLRTSKTTRELRSLLN